MILDFFLPLLIAVGLVLGAVAHFLSYEVAAQAAWQITLAIGALPFLYRGLRAVIRGHFGVDAIAIVAMLVAFAIGQYFAGVVILLMLASGSALESYAQGRAKRELTLLVSRAPANAHRKTADHQLADVNVDDVVVGDLLVVKPGEVVPVDSVVVSGRSTVDESAISGESLPVGKQGGSLVYSGSVNKDDALEVRTIKTSGESKYQNIVKLVRIAHELEAPVVRLADRYAVAFNAITFAAVLLTWAVFRDPTRVLAVLVVASPCPLILATPIAMISGISRAASRGIVVKSGTALEKLGGARGLIFDKTGTLTVGEPEVARVVSLGPVSEREVLRVAASIDQLSAHILARSLVNYAQQQSVTLTYPEYCSETFGQGLQASLDGRAYAVGTVKFLARLGVTITPDVEVLHEALRQEGKTIVCVASAAALLGYVVFADIVRPDTVALFTALQQHDVPNVIMLTGDRESVAATIAKSVGITEYHAELAPEDKVVWVRRLQEKFGPLAMVGDGVNDAPALATASVGMAMASNGATAASETGDVVILTNSIERVHDAVHIAQSSLRLAKQGMVVGMGVSVLLMVLAFLGYVTPVAGAVAQEVVDVAVILNALRLTVERIT